MEGLGSRTCYLRWEYPVSIRNGSICGCGCEVRRKDVHSERERVGWGGVKDILRGLCCENLGLYFVRFPCFFSPCRFPCAFYTCFLCHIFLSLLSHLSACSLFLFDVTQVCKKESSTSRYSPEGKKRSWHDDGSRMCSRAHAFSVWKFRRGGSRGSQGSWASLFLEVGALPFSLSTSVPAKIAFRSARISQPGRMDLDGRQDLVPGKGGRGKGWLSWMGFGFGGWESGSFFLF